MTGDAPPARRRGPKPAPPLSARYSRVRPVSASDLRAWIDEAGLTAANFGWIAGYAPSTVSLWLAGRRPIPALVRLLFEPHDWTRPEDG